MKIFSKIIVLLLTVILLFTFASCGFLYMSCADAVYESQEFKYYSDKDNYVNVRGVVDDFSYDEDKESLFINFTDLVSEDDFFETFKITGKNLDIVESKDIKNKMEKGSQIEFISAPRMFGDGYIYPIVSITINGETLLDFDEGVENLLKTYK